MSSGRSATLGSATIVALLLACGAARAIEAAPQQNAAPTPAPAAAIEPTDESTFYELLQRVTHFRNLRGLGVAPQVVEALAKGEADRAVGALSAAAATGNREANVALVRIQHWCGRMSSARPPDARAQIAKLGEVFSAERAKRAAGVIQAEAAFIERARTGCSKAQFDYRAIENRLREAADAGHPASATELAQFVRDATKRQALLDAAIAKQYAPAMYAVASNRLIAVQRGETTENVGSIRLLLKQAGRSMPKAKLDLANCMALGCDGHPVDALSAHAFGIDAARDGEPLAFLSMMRMPWGRRLSREQMLAWQYFGDRLNEAGCMGDAYLASSQGFAQSIPALEKGMEQKALDTARAQAQELWNQNGARAQQENGCAQTAAAG